MFRALIEQTEQFIKDRLAADSSGHDWFHVDRVRRSAVLIGAAEGADLFITELGALLHDVADWKFHAGDEDAGPRAAREWLTSQNVAPEHIAQVEAIIREVSYKGAGVATRPSTLEGQVVQDADRLDAIGAIGIARAFAYGGHKGRGMYDPLVPPTPHDSFDAYKKNSGPTINHFYEKLLLLKDRLNTATARQIAASRHRFMEDFLAQFYREWNGEDYRPVCG
jgi:uncharacterized protein